MAGKEKKKNDKNDKKRTGRGQGAGGALLSLRKGKARTGFPFRFVVTRGNGNFKFFSFINYR